LGYYKCAYNYTQNKIACVQLSNSHQDVWKTFYDLLSTLADKVAGSNFLKPDRDMLVEYLYSIRFGLSCGNKINAGNWLSLIRNQVNYSHSMGAWFPYSGNSNLHNSLFRLLEKWTDTPSKIQEQVVFGKELLLFVETCVSIVSLARALILDLNSVSEKSFLEFGAMKFLKISSKHK